MYNFSSSGYSDESSPYIVSTPKTSSAPRLAASQQFGKALENEQKRRADLYAGVLDGKARVDAAKYGQAPTQPNRQPSIGDQLAAGLAKPLGTLASGLVGGLFGGGTAPADYSNVFSSSGPTFSPSSFTGGFDLAPAAATLASGSNYGSAFGSTGLNFNPSASFGFLN